MSKRGSFSGSASFASSSVVRGMLEVSRKIDDSLWTSQQLGRSKQEVAQMQARCHAFRHLPDPTQPARDEGYHSQEQEWMQMEDHQPACAATSGGRVGTSDTLTERVEPRSFVAAGDRVLVHLSNATSTACPGGTRQSQRTNVPAEEPEQLETQLPRQKGS